MKKMMFAGSALRHYYYDVSVTKFHPDCPEADVDLPEAPARSERGGAAVVYVRDPARRTGAEGESEGLGEGCEGQHQDGKGGEGQRKRWAVLPVGNTARDHAFRQPQAPQ